MNLKNIDRNSRKIELREKIYSEFLEFAFRKYDLEFSEEDKEDFMNLLAFYSIDSFKAKFLNSAEIISHYFNSMIELIEFLEDFCNKNELEIIKYFKILYYLLKD